MMDTSVVLWCGLAAIVFGLGRIGSELSRIATALEKRTQEKPLPRDWAGNIKVRVER